MTSYKKVSPETRLGSMVVDHIIMIIICLLFAAPLLISSILETSADSHNQGSFNPFGNPWFYLALIGFAIYPCKDCINGRSLAKRITGLQVVDNATEQPASPIRCFIRNVFCILWPLEVILTLFNPTRRIGDMVAGTRIAVYDPASPKKKAEIKKIFIPLVISFVFMLFITSPIQLFKLTKIKYVESSYNDTESKMLEEQFRNTLGEYLSASVRVYDKVEDQDIKYISVIYKLKDNYLEDEDDSRQLQKMTERVLYSTFPKNTFKGQAKYIYRGRGSFHSRTNQIGK